jgi:hypothetical protein
MKKARTLNSLFLAALVLPPLLSGADLSTYRGFQFGMPLSSAVKHSGMDVSEVAVIHERPARIQELSWRPARFSSNGNDPVEQVLFTFYNGELSRMAIDYDNEKTEGLTPGDMIAAISLRYGVATSPTAEIVLASASFSEGVVVIARWENADYSFNLARSPYGSRFELIAFSKRLDGLAQASIAAGDHLDEQEAPERLKSQEQGVLVQQQKARLVNQEHFRP